jgi:hypothetical protein
MKGNWKTSLAAGLILLSQVGSLFGVPPKVVAVSSAIIAAAGLGVAKDGDVTGGTRTPEGEKVAK